MTIRRVALGGDNTDGSTWAKAYTTFGAAVTASSANGDVIWVDKDFTEEVAVDTTYTFSNNVSVICVDKDASDVLATMGTAAWIGNSTANRALSLLGGYKVFLYGITFRIGGSTADVLTINTTAGGEFILDSCYLWQGDSSSSAYISVNSPTATVESYTNFRNCTFRFGSAGQFIACGVGKVIIEGGVLPSSSGSVPTTLFASGGSGVVVCDGVDLSAVTGSLVGNQTSGFKQFDFKNCKFGSGVVVMVAQSTYNNQSQCEVNIFNCSAADQHYHFGHYNAHGSTIMETGIYANDGALYDGTNHIAWKIVTTAYATIYDPYVSPWIERYWGEASAITPYMEILRDGSATAYKDNEVWGEWAAQTVTGYPLATFTTDRVGLVSTEADQAAGMGTGSWTGEGGTAWSGKVVSPSMTPAEIGMLKGRFCVGLPSTTVYVDPTIRT